LGAEACQTGDTEREVDLARRLELIALHRRQNLVRDLFDVARRRCRVGEVGGPWTRASGTTPT
jgi:hypothetical protein